MGARLVDGRKLLCESSATSNSGAQERASSCRAGRREIVRSPRLSTCCWRKTGARRSRFRRGRIPIAHGAGLSRRLTALREEDDEPAVARQAVAELRKQVDAGFVREGGYAPLRLRNPERLLKKWTPKTFAEGEVRPVVIGIDAGSTGLKIAIIDAVTGALLYKEYAFNGDNQLAALDAMMKRVKQEIGAHIDVLHTAVTGSGRNAVAVMLGKPTVRTEILAHKTGVLETFKELGIKPTTYWELGGQDSKSMSLEQFIMAMNDLCSAGSVRSSKRWRNALASTRTKTPQLSTKEC